MPDENGEEEKIDKPPKTDRDPKRAGRLKGAVAPAIAISFFLTLAISILFQNVLDQGLSAGIPIVGVTLFLLSLGGILLVRQLRGMQ